MHTYSLAFKERFAHTILDNQVSRVVQFSFPKGKILDTHKTSSDILVQVIHGRVKFKAADMEETWLQPGELLSLEPHVEHAVEALEDSVVLLILTPSPSSHSIFKPDPDKGGSEHAGA